MPRPKTRDPDLPPRYYRKHGSIYFVQKNKWQLIGKDTPDAWRHHLSELDSDTSRPETVDILLHYYSLEIIPQKGIETQKTNRRECRWLLKVFTGVRLCDIEPTDAAAYIRARGAPTRATREIALLSHALSWAAEQGWIKRNPFIGAPRSITMHGLRKSAARTSAEAGQPLHRPIDPDAYFAFLCHGHPLAIAAAEVSGLTGLRKPDILNLRTEWVKGDGLYAVISKSSQYRSPHPPAEVFFAWTPALRSAISLAQEVRSEVESEYLFHTRRGGRLSLSGFDQIWQDSMRGRPDRFTWHSVRNSVGAFLTQTSGLTSVQAQLTHSNALTSMRYSRAVRFLPALDQCVLDALRFIRQSSISATPENVSTT